jgi:hypothetical protein
MYITACLEVHLDRRMFYFSTESGFYSNECKKQGYLFMTPDTHVFRTLSSVLPVCDNKAMSNEIAIARRSAGSAENPSATIVRFVLVMGARYPPCRTARAI